ncbi:MAG: tRNA (N6-threonylcarbamoyladenosine(37)-N6)-methyltransferase TrmO [bacterium]
MNQKEINKGMHAMHLKPIGIIHSPFQSAAQAPRQGHFTDKTSTLENFDAYADGLKTIERASHLIVFYWLDRADRDTLQTYTPHGAELRGVFACRSPARPNPIGFAVAKLIKREGQTFIVKGLDAVDQTPIIDIKPYSPDLDAFPEAILR